MDDQRAAGAHDPRIDALLADPHQFFAAARRRAWLEAAKDIQLDLERRERSRSKRAVRRRTNP